MQLLFFYLYLFFFKQLSPPSNRDILMDKGTGESPSFASHIAPYNKKFAKEETDEAKDVRDRELIMQRIGRTKGAAFLRRWTEQRIFAVTGLYIQQSRETHHGTVVRSSFGWTKEERLIGSGDCVDQTSAEDSEHNVSVIEKAIGAQDSFLVSGCIDQGAGSIPGTTVLSHGNVAREGKIRGWSLAN